MSKLTDFLSLFKWDTSNETDLKSKFNIETALNENWDKIDEQLESLDNRATTSENNIESQNTKVDNREHTYSYYTYEVTEDISSGSEITLPCSYVVGSDNLVLYDFFGKRLIKDEHYSEVGDDGAESTTITLLFDVVYSEEYEKVFDIVIKEVDA